MGETDSLSGDNAHQEREGGPADGSRRRRPGRVLLVAWVHLAVLWSFAVAQPLFDVLADTPEFFLARGNTREDILIFAFVLSLVLPTALWAIEVALVRVEVLRALVHLVFVGLLSSAIALQVLDDSFGGSSVILIPVSLFLGVGTGLLYTHGRVVSSMLTVLAPVPAVFLSFFLLFSPVSQLVLPQDESGAATAKGGRTPVVMIVFDEFRLPSVMDSRHRIDAARFPNMARLTREFTWYRNATTVADHTALAVPAILSGKIPQASKLPIVSEYPRNLFTLLGTAYSKNVREAITFLCPERLCQRASEPLGQRLSSLASDLSVVSLHRLLPEDVRDHLPAVHRTFANFRNGDVGGSTPLGTGGGLAARRLREWERGAAFDSFVRSIEPAPSRPSLNFLHSMLPHVPWFYLPSGQLYPDRGFETPGLTQDVDNWGKDGWTDKPWLPNQAFQRQMLQVAYVDRLVGHLISRLKETGLYDRALVVLVADHGVNFERGEPRRAITEDNLGAIASVPLFLKRPHQRRGGIDDSPARIIDILPTIVDILDLKSPRAMDGHTLLESRRRGPKTVRIAKAHGSSVSASFPAFVRARNAEIDATTALFGSGGMGGIYRMGPDADLVGMSLNTLPTKRALTARVELDEAHQFASVNLHAALLPAYVTGTLHGIKAGSGLAVAVNGRIQAVAPAIELEGKVRVAAMVAPGAFRQGTNDVRVLEVRHSVPDPSLVLLHRRRYESFKVVQTANGKAILGSSGTKVPISPGSAHGVIEQVRIRDGTLTAEGWAATSGQPAERLLLFFDGQYMGAARPSLARPDIAKVYGHGAKAAGYELTAKLGDVATANVSKVRLFAVARGRASELPRLR